VLIDESYEPSPTLEPAGLRGIPQLATFYWKRAGPHRGVGSDDGAPVESTEFRKTGAADGAIPALQDGNALSCWDLIPGAALPTKGILAPNTRKPRRRTWISQRICPFSGAVASC
jgi:hypothetical protein